MISEEIVFTNDVANITRIRVMDMTRDGSGGYASIVSGGVDYKYVTIRLQSSAVGRGYDFFVDIYGN